LLSNIEAYAGSVALLSITAPGVDGVAFWWKNPAGWVDVPGWRAHEIPWADARRQHADPAVAIRWNRSAPRRWRELHRAAAQRARRAHGVLSVVSRTWEYQRRGLLHVHVVLGMATPRERAAAHAYALAVEDLRERHGFGFVSDTSRSSSWRQRGLEVIVAERAARYVAKYLSPLKDGKPTLSETVTRRDVPAHVIHVGRFLTARTGMTMRYLRWRRKAYMLKLPAIDPRTGELVSSLIARCRDAERGAEDDLEAYLAVRQNEL
jgi:hypothetical protein